MPHEQLPYCSILTFHCHYHFKTFRLTQFNTNTLYRQILEKYVLLYSGISTPLRDIYILSCLVLLYRKQFTVYHICSMIITSIRQKPAIKDRNVYIYFTFDLGFQNFTPLCIKEIAESRTLKQIFSGEVSIFT